MAKPARSNESEGSKRWKKDLARACLTGNVEEVERLLSVGTETSDIDADAYDAGLRSAVQAAASSGQQSIINILIENGAADLLPQHAWEFALQQAVEKRHPDVLFQLLVNGGQRLLEENEKFARTLLLSAALKGDVMSLNILANCGADINHKDERERTVLVQLAADKPLGRNVGGVVEWFIKTRKANPKHRGEKGMTALHCAVSTGKIELTQALLVYETDIEAPSERGKTALHLAAASKLKESDKIVELLLNAGADPTKESDGRWTPLHNAAQVGNVEVVQRLLKTSANPNAMLSSGVTPLHWAAARGNEKCVKELLNVEGIRRHQEDTFGSTPMLRAAQNGHSRIVKMLAPEHDAERLSAYELKACKSETFEATMVNFEHKKGREGQIGLKSRNGHVSIYDMLYDPNFTIRIQQETSPSPSRPNFRWLHLPSNNMAWAKTLITKIFVEDQTEDIDAFKALQKTFAQRHRGPEVHSTFMIPSCQYIRSNKREPVRPRPSIVVEDRSEGPGLGLGLGLATQPETPGTPTPEGSVRPFHRRGPRNKRRGSTSLHGGPRTPVARTTMDSVATLISETSTIGLMEDTPYRKPGNIAMFMPYLHYETHDRREEMSHTIKTHSPNASNTASLRTCKSPDDEMLIRAYLDSSDNLHPRRTLDQFLYHGFDTEERDIDQVVYRYCKKKGLPLKVFMVDQLWLWIFGKDLIVTCFPQRWGQKMLRNDPLNVLGSIIEDINSKTRPPVDSVSDLAILIFSRCLGSFDRHRLGDVDYQFMDMFESSIGHLSVREPEMFKEFRSVASQAALWLKEQDIDNRRRNMLEDEKLKFVNKLLDIEEETELLKELKDIRDELNIIKLIFQQQMDVLRDFEESINEQQRDLDETMPMGLDASQMGLEQSGSRGASKRHEFKEQKKLMLVHIRDVERMDRQAQAIFDSLTQLLDFKQKHANAVEAKVARVQAGLTARQGETIMVFTIVTIFFLPVSFLAAFFAINVKEFSRNEGFLTLSYVSKYVFGIGLSISVVLITVAFLIDDLRGKIQKLLYGRPPAEVTRVPEKAESVRTIETVDESRAVVAAGSYLREGDEMRRSFEPSLPERILSGLSNSAFSAMTGRSGIISLRRGRPWRRRDGDGVREQGNV